jgi:broad specificity phosphatase PhoE
MILANRDCQTAAVVAHGGVVKVLLCKAIGAPLSSFWNVASDAAGLSIIDYYDGGALVRLANDTSHLGGLDVCSGSVYNPAAGGISVRKK